jgi:hypothetical protein
MYPACREEDDLLVLRELAVKPMRKLGPLQPYVERLVARGLVRRTRAGWAPTNVGRLVLERVGQTLH